MTDICLFLSEAALRGAVTEQLGALSDVNIQYASDFTEALGSTASILIGDYTKQGTLTQESATGRKIFLMSSEDVGIQNSGAEIFVKPFYLGQLLDRILFHMNVVSRLKPATIVFSGYRLDTQSRQLVVKASGDVLRLTEKETAILEHLAHSPKSVTRDELLAAVWGYDGRIDTHTLETHIYQLRRKLDPSGARDDILCHDNHGYFLKDEG